MLLEMLVLSNEAEQHTTSDNHVDFVKLLRQFGVDTHTEILRIYTSVGFSVLFLTRIDAAGNVQWKYKITSSAG